MKSDLAWQAFKSTPVSEVDVVPAGKDDQAGTSVFGKAARQSDTPTEACMALKECLPDATTGIIYLSDEYQ